MKTYFTLLLGLLFSNSALSQYYLAAPDGTQMTIATMTTSGYIDLPNAKPFSNPNAVGSPTIPLNFIGCNIIKGLGALAHGVAQGEDLLIANYLDPNTKANYLLFAAFDAVDDRWEVNKVVHLDFNAFYPYTWVAHHCEVNWLHPNSHNLIMLISEESSLNNTSYDPNYGGELIELNLPAMLSAPGPGIITVNTYTQHVAFGFSADFQGLYALAMGGAYVLDKVTNYSITLTPKYGQIGSIAFTPGTTLWYPNLSSIPWAIQIGDLNPWNTSATCLSNFLLFDYYYGSQGLVYSNYFSAISSPPYIESSIVQTPPYFNSGQVDVGSAIFNDAAHAK